MLLKEQAMLNTGSEAFLVGEWVVEPELNVLRRGTLECRVEPKVMRVLLTLAARPGRVVSKESLIAAVWPDTFVSDDVLTRCISILRRIAQDDPQAPRFIQTVPRVGYRLVARVEAAAAPTPIAAVSATLPQLIAGSVQTQPVPVVSRDYTPPSRPGARTLAAVAVLLLLALFGVAWPSFSSHKKSPAAAEQLSAFRTAFRTRQFTFSAGEQMQPAFAPDGKSIAFVRLAEDGSSRRIYVRAVGADVEAPAAAEQDQQQFSPAWSPDGHRIAYLGQSKGVSGLYVTSVGSGKAAQRILTLHARCHWDQNALSWAPDGKSLIFADQSGSQPGSSIFAFDLETRGVRALTSPPADWEGDLNPVFSPDGKRIAFTRASETAVRDIDWIPATGGQPHELTRDRMNIDSLAWSPDSSSVVFSSNRGGKFGLWSVGLDANQPVRLPIGTEDAFEPAAGPKPGQFAYVQGSAIWSIERLSAGTNQAAAQTETVLSSTQQDSAPSLSPDGRFFAIQSVRSGFQEIWISSIRGDALRQLTTMGGPLTGSPAWSRGGGEILFDSRLAGHAHVFVAGVAGGPPRQLTFGDTNDIVPRWSHDDRAVYFRSNRSGRWRLWRVAAEGGVPQPVTSGDGIEPQESPDGKWLYYTRGDEAGLWRASTDGVKTQGAETKILDQPAAGYWGYWQLTTRGIVYLDLRGAAPAIRLLDLRSGQTSSFAELRQMPPPFAGFAVAGDASFVLATGERDRSRRITLVEAQ